MSDIKKKGSSEMEICQICQDVNILYLECCHCMCKKCFVELAEKDIANMTCEVCKKLKLPNILISEKDKKDILGAKTYDNLYNNFNLELFGNIVECPKCHEKNSFEKGEVDYNIKDDNNKLLSKTAAEHYAENRCRCLNCQAIFVFHVKLVLIILEKHVLSKNYLNHH